jgi:hypothetical protein
MLSYLKLKHTEYELLPLPFKRKNVHLLASIVEDISMKHYVNEVVKRSLFIRNQDFITFFIKMSH